MPRESSPCRGISDWMLNTVWRTIMSDAKENSKLFHRELTDTELDAASGGRNKPGRVPANEPVRVPAKVTIPDLELG